MAFMETNDLESLAFCYILPMIPIIRRDPTIYGWISFLLKFKFKVHSYLGLRKRGPGFGVFCKCL